MYKINIKNADNTRDVFKSSNSFSLTKMDVNKRSSTAAYTMPCSRQPAGKTERLKKKTIISMQLSFCLLSNGSSLLLLHSPTTMA